MEEEQMPSQMLSEMLSSAPIPGQSLTKEMGHTPIERPAKITDMDEALEFFWDKFHEEDVFPMIIGSLETGIEAELLMRSIVLGAVFQGFISIDMGMIVAQPVYAMICAMGDRAGVKYTKRMKGKSQKEKIGKFLEDIAQASPDEELEDSTEEEEEEGMPETEESSMAILGGGASPETEEEMPAMGMLGGGMQ